MALVKRSATHRLWKQVVFSSLLPAVAVIGLDVQSAGAQLFDSGRLAVAPNFGVAVPTGTIGKMVLPGPTFGLQLMYKLSPRIAAGFEGGYDSHEGSRSPSTLFSGPPFQVLRYGVSAEVALLPPRSGAFTILAGGGAGLATMLSEPLYNPAAPPIGVTLGGPGDTEHTADPLQFEGSYPAFNGRLQLAYVATQAITLFVEGHASTSLLDEAKTTVFVQGPYPVAELADDGTLIFVTPTDSLEPPSSLSSVGLRIGLRRSF